MLNEKNTKAENPRTLEIKLMVAMQSRQWLIFIMFMTMTCALLWLLIYGVTREPFFTSTQLLVTVVLAVMTVLRIRYLKSIFLRIDDNGFSWRLVDGVDMQQMHPPISEHDIRWKSVRELHHEASGIRFSLHEKKDVFLPLSNFSYAQRQDIKRVIGLHLSEHDITAFVFTPVGWHDDPDVEAGAGDDAALEDEHGTREDENATLEDDVSIHDSPTTEPR